MKKIWAEHKRLLLIGLTGLLLISAGGSFFFFKAKKQGATSYVQQDVAGAAVEKELEVPERNAKSEDLETLNVLLLGYGGAGHQGGGLTDVIQVLHLNFEKDQIALISIPRDLWVSLPNGQAAKINKAFTFNNSGQATKKMTSIVTGLPLDYFIAIDFVGFKRLIGEELSSITVDIPQTLEDPWYPIQGEELNPCGKAPQEIAELTANYSGFELEKQFECRYEHLYFPAGEMRLEGGEALKYVRSRHGSSGGDFDRSQRQQVVLAGIKDKLLSLEAFKKAPAIFKQVERHVQTDLNLETIKYLLPALEGLGSYEAEGIVLSTENVLTTGKTGGGQFALRPKAGFNQWQPVHLFVKEQLRK